MFGNRREENVGYRTILKTKRNSKNIEILRRIKK